MCNGCGFGCCASDVFFGCGCDCRNSACWERCDFCGDVVLPGDCCFSCDEEYDYGAPEDDEVLAS